MPKPRVYLAGKISKMDWRLFLVPNLRETSFENPLIETDLYTYVGPFFVSCDHGCNHQDNSHGAIAGYKFGESPYKSTDVIRNNNAGLNRADLVFAYITSIDCFGTLFELGYATRAGKTVVIAFAPKIPHTDFWYSTHQAKRIHTEVRPCCLASLLEKELLELA